MEIVAKEGLPAGAASATAPAAATATGAPAK
jgi:hypothetical protein